MDVRVWVHILCVFGIVLYGTFAIFSITSEWISFGRCYAVAFFLHGFGFGVVLGNKNMCIIQNLQHIWPVRRPAVFFMSYYWYVLKCIHTYIYMLLLVFNCFNRTTKFAISFRFDFVHIKIKIKYFSRWQGYI